MRGGTFTLPNDGGDIAVSSVEYVGPITEEMRTYVIEQTGGERYEET